MKLCTFSYLGIKSLSLRVARRTSDVSCERAKDLIGCQKVEAGDLGLGGAGARLKRDPEPLLLGSDLLPVSGKGGMELLMFKPRTELKREPF